MTKLKEKVNQLNQLIISGNTIKAMEIFYSADIEMQENEDTPRKGKDVCIEIEKQHLQKVKKSDCTLLNQAIDSDKNVVFSEWSFVITHKDNTIWLLTEVSVQYWLNGEVYREKFYYKNLRKAS